MSEKKPALRLKNISSRPLVLSFPEVLSDPGNPAASTILFPQFVKMAVPDEVFEVPPEHHERVAADLKKRNSDRANGGRPFWEWTDAPVKTAQMIADEADELARLSA